MAKQFTALTTNLQEFIEKQKLFFIASADQDGKINLSPKGLDSLRILDKNRIIWLNLTGSGNETAAHVLGVNRITLMFCSFDKTPLILRLYGHAKFYQPGDKEWDQFIGQFPEFLGPRQIFDITIEMVQTSCGYGVPEFTFKQDRTLLSEWCERKGEDGIKDYWKEKNQLSMDGKPTGIKIS